MKKIFTLLFLVGLFGSSNAQWINLDSMITVRCAFMSGAINDTGYAVSGGGSNGYVSQAEMYIRSTNTWQAIADFPDGGHGNSVAGFAIGDTVYCGLGAAGGYSYSNSFWKYDPHTNTWTPINGIPGQGRAGAVSFVINGKGYVGGGLNSGVPNTYGNDNPVNDFFVYDPSTGQWDSIAPCPAKGIGFQCTAFVLNGKAYVGTGGQQVGVLTQTYDPVADFWCYDPATNVWDSVAPFGGGNRMGCFAFGTCNFGYVGTGVSDANQSHFRRDVWKFDPTNGPLGTWTQVDSLAGSSRSCSHAFVIGSHGYVCGGMNAYPYNSLGSLWEYLPLDTPKFSAPASICAGTQVTFTDTSNYAPTNWQWNFQGGTPDTSSAQNPVITYNTPGSYDVTFTAWSGDCDSGSMVYTQYITVGAGLTVGVTPTNPQVCSGQSVKLVASGGTSYQWVGTTDTTDSLTVSPSKDTTYELLITNGACNKDTFIAVHTGGVLSINVLPMSPTICSGQSITLKASGGSTYNWSPSTGLAVTTGDSVVANPSASVTYTVTATDSFGCSGTGMDTLTVVPVPNTPTISQHGDTLVSSASTENQWYLNGVAISGATGQDLIIGKNTGIYTVAVINPADGCTSNSGADTTSDINQLTINNNQLSIYPNPTNGTITVKIMASTNDIKDWNLQLTDVLGRTVYTRNSLNFTNEVDLSNLSSGVYFIVVTNKTGEGVFKVVKE